jgi:hypothetical protein
MKKNLLLEIEKIRNMMGLTINENNFVLEKFYNSLNTNTTLLNEQSWLDDLLKLGKGAFENEDLMKSVIKQLDDDAKAGNKVKLPEFDSAGRKLTREEQIEQFTKKLAQDAENIETAYKSNALKSQSSYQKFQEFVNASANATGRKANDALLNSIIVQKTSSMFEKTDSIWLKMYDEVVEEIRAEISTHIDDQVPFNEDDMLKLFNEKLNKKLKELPQVKTGGRKVSDFTEYYDWAWKKFTNKSGGFDGLLGDLPGHAALMTPSKSRSAMRTKTGSKSTSLLPSDEKLFTMGKNFTYVEQLITSLVNQIKTIFTGVDEIALRMERRQYILETYDYGSLMKDGVIPEELQGLLRAHYNDLQMLGTLEKNFLKYWDEFVDGMKQSGWPVDKLEKAFEETEVYGSWRGVFFKSESLLEALKEYEKVYRYAIQKEFGPIKSKLSEFYNTMVAQYKNVESKFSTIKDGIAVEKTVGGKILAFLKEVPRNILSLLSYWSLFTPKAIGRMLRLAGGGTGNIKTILYGFIAVDIGLVLWKKIFKTAYAAMYYLYASATGSDTGNEETGTYMEQFLNEAKNIWTGIFTGTFSELTNEDGWDFIKGFDISGSYFWNLIFKNFATDKPDVADSNIQMSYNERLSELWEKIPEKDKDNTIKVLASQTTSNFGYFEFEVKNEPNKIIEQNPGVTKEDLDKILLSRVGKIEVSEIDVDLDISETLKTLQQRQISQEEIDKKTNSLIDRALNSIKVGAFKTKNNYFYMITRNTTFVNDLQFYFEPIPFTKQYRKFKKTIGKTSYTIYYDEFIDKKPRKLEYDELIDKGIDMGSYQLNSNKEFTNEDEVNKVLKLLNDKIPESEVSNEKLTIKQFANKL